MEKRRRHKSLFGRSLIKLNFCISRFTTFFDDEGKLIVIFGSKKRKRICPYRKDLARI